MSRNSKVRRDARKKQAGKRPVTRAAAPAAMHAQLSADGRVIGGVQWRDGEWVMVLGGKDLAGTDSAAMAMAMLRHVAAVRESDGQAVGLMQSIALREAATREAELEGKSLEEFLAQLEAERLERKQADAP